MKMVGQKKYFFKLNDVLLTVFVLIVIFSIIELNIINKKVTPNILKISEAKINKILSIALTNSFQDELLKEELGNIIVLDKTGSEIGEVNFNLREVYKVVSVISARLRSNISLIEKGQWQALGIIDNDLVKKDGFILSLPIGIGSSSLFFASLGPRIPVKVKILNTMLSGIETRITSYGINNALIEIYMKVEIEKDIITPVILKNNKQDYTILIASKIIYGRIPSIYSGTMTRESNLNIPIN